MVATDGLTEPLSVENVTGTPASTLPLESLIVALMVDVPPASIVDGAALNESPVAAAAPIGILIAPVVPVDTPPESAKIVAVPDCVPALNVTITRPPASVSTSIGSIVPSVVVNVTSVPRCGGVPDGSMTCAMMLVLPLSGNAEASGVSVIVDPAGARSATRSHAVEATLRSAASTPMTIREEGQREPVIMKSLTILNPMNLRGQHTWRRSRPSSAEAGYAMAVLLVAMGVMAVVMTAMMPVWKQIAQREKEQELVFRGQQYARAIGLFQRKYANTPPPSLDVLVQEHFLRKKYKDPITNADFVPIPAGQAGAAAPGGAPGSALAGRGALIAGQPISGSPGVTSARGGIIGVTSASTAQSIRVYNGATRYNQWRFVYAPAAATPGGGAPGTATPGPGRGQRGQPPGPSNQPGGIGRGPAGRGAPAGRGGPNPPGLPSGRGGPGVPPPR